MSHLYALLVGINKYPGLKNRELKHAESDIVKVKNFLQSHVPNASIKVLTGNDATKSSVAKAFQSHFGKASNTDVGLYYFSGHGGKIVSPPDEICHLEPGRDGSFETTVLYDSRSSHGQGDLSDKELAYLINTYFNSNGHFLAVLDCCFSGDGARVENENNHAALKSAFERFEQPLSHFIGYSPRNRNYGKVDKPLVQIAAAEEGKPAVDGLFTDKLINKLEAGGTRLSYEALIRSLASEVWKISQDTQQRPGIYANQSSLKQLRFLNGLAT